MNKDIKKGLLISFGVISIIFGLSMILASLITVYGGYEAMRTPSFVATELIICSVGIILGGICTGLLEFKQLGTVGLIANVMSMVLLLGGLQGLING